MDALGNACAGFNEDELAELKDIAKLYLGSKSFVMKLASWVGDKAEDLTAKLPDDWQDKIGEATELALRSSYWLAESTQEGDDPASLKNRALGWAKGEQWHSIATGVTGALGGFGGIATTLVDLPVTTTLILRSIQQIAKEHGEDLSDERVRKDCLAVFGLGGPLEEDDEVETGFMAARVSLTGATVAEMLKLVLPRFGVPVSQKVLAQATPVLGALTGATLNYSFNSYYQSMAHVHFRLRKLERSHDHDQVRACFQRVLKSLRSK